MPLLACIVLSACIEKLLLVGAITSLCWTISLHRKTYTGAAVTKMLAAFAGHFQTPLAHL